MKTYNNKYRGFNIHIEVEGDRAEFRVETSEKKIMEDTKGYCVTVEQAMDECQEMIDQIIEENS